jgi:hypothetical protein
MSNVRSLRPLLSVPHMLRQWADEFESGSEAMPKSVILVAIDKNPEAIPTIYSAGQEMNRCEEIGALFVAARITSETGEGL